ncbi:hypothetical protein PCANC_10030 [Puccinia coronata f. sp. avenae]|uniref:Integrase zinc-binding domain-containing protein n=1 Tax=Puccinia coronata f. sp. avenae TaxID=200324 RepID=A0A2N5UZ78_9BASI|nr:hypothetical protein PCANC_10030 [Puccinia coronata f. sp. avenae]
MSYSPSAATPQPNGVLEGEATGLRRIGSGSCIDGSDGYPTLANFTARMEKYLTGKKHPDRTVISSAELHQIRQLLLDPAALRADPNPNHRTWVKKAFFLESTPVGKIVCHKEKGHSTGRPIAVKELLYFILKEAHASEGHGGRDKTAKAVKVTHSYIRKGLICIFLDTCPTCQTRIEATKKEKALTLDKAGLNMTNRDSIVSFGTGFMSPATSPTNFGIRRNLDGAHPNSLFKPASHSNDLSAPPHLMISRPIMPPELALVPAAPKPYSRSRNASFPSCSISRKGQRMLSSGANVGDHPSAPVGHLPYPIMPNTAIASDFSSRDLTCQTLEFTGMTFDQGVSIAEGLPPIQQHPGVFPGESYQPQTPVWVAGNHANTPAWQIEFSNIWAGQEPVLNTSIPAPLVAPQPQFPSPFKIPFIDHLVSSENNNLQFNSWSTISPMSHVFPS